MWVLSPLRHYSGGREWGVEVGVIVLHVPVVRRGASIVAGEIDDGKKKWMFTVKAERGKLRKSLLAYNDISLCQAEYSQ